MNFFLKIINYIKSLFVAIIWVSTVVVVWCLVSLSVIISKLGFHSLGDYLMNCVKKTFVSGCALGMSNTRIVFTGDLDKFKETLNSPAVVICNHQTYFDWWYIWLIADFYHKARSLNIMLKASLQKVPLLGTVMKRVGFLFLERNWEKDSSNIDAYMKQFCAKDRNDWLLIFPEGTTRSNGTLQKSMAYAKKTDRPITGMVLLPHATGLASILNSMYINQKIHGTQSYIYNMTMQFTTFDGTTPNGSFLGGTFNGKGIPHLLTFTTERHPIECHIHIEVDTIDSVLQGAVEQEEVIKNTEQWLDDKYVKKDQMITKFIKDQQFKLENNDKKIVLDYKYIRRFLGIFVVIISCVIGYGIFSLLKYIFLLPFRL
ncbi:hypothetical protein WA158_008323 [Blastocystis sp. Blastoise]